MRFRGEPAGAGLPFVMVLRPRRGIWALSRQNSFIITELVLRSSGCSAVLADQAVDDLPALDPARHIDRLTGLVQRRSLVPRLVTGPAS
jgi:hypothetical protein